MQLLLDQAFPSHCEVLGNFGVQLIRWNQRELTDIELLDATAGLEMAGVVFLGVGIISAKGLVEAAGRRGLYLAATWETNPQLITGTLSNNLQGLNRAVRPGGVDILYAREIRPARRWWES